MIQIVRLLAVGLAVGGLASAQGILPLEPFRITGDLFVTDSDTDSVWRLQDLNQDGDYNDFGEVVRYYSSALGTIALSNNTGIAVGPDGTVFVSDSTTDIVLALLDLDGNGDALGPNEHWVYFNGTPGGNASNVVMTSAQELTVDASGVVWVASANVSTGGIDAVLRLQDLGGLPGANDPGEAAVYYDIVPGSATGVSIPTSVSVGPGGFLYYLENGTSGTPARGIYRLHDDVIPNGNCNDPGEVSPFFIPPAQAGTAFLWGMTVGSGNEFYVVDQGNDIVWKAADLDANLVVSAGSPESVLYWTSPVPSLNWSVSAASDGSIVTCESQAPDRILRMADTVVVNGHVNDPGEVVAVYDNTVSPTIISNPRAAAFQRWPTLTLPAAPSIGTVALLSLDAAAGHPFGVWYSTGTVSIAIPPLGTLGISIFPPHFFGELYGGIIPAGGTHSLGAPIPYNLGLIGFSLHLQGFAGLPARVQLSNPQTVTFQP